ncbi:MAG: hypothetical protein WDM81_14630 [Rhizomicrobium sp.]
MARQRRGKRDPEGPDRACAGAGQRRRHLVEKFNPALRLYRRLGFGEVSDSDVYMEMEWREDQLKIA